MRTVSGTLLLGVVVGAVLAGAPALAAHPAEGHPTRSLEGRYGPGCGLPAAWTTGDLVFFDAAERPPLARLSQLERYILAGVSSSNVDALSGLMPWHVELFTAVRLFYAAYGYVPERLTPELIKQVPGLEDYPGELMELWRNPLTGEWPRLTDRDPAPGDAYIRPLTEREQAHFAELNWPYRREWIEGYALDGATNRWRPVKITSPVFYLRISGWQGPLYEGFNWTSEWQ